MSRTKLLDLHRAQLRRRAFYFVVVLSNLIAGPLIAAQTETLEPVASFTARVIFGENVLVGATPEREGTAWQSNLFFISETLNRTVLEYDIRGRSLANAAILNLELANGDAPDFSTIFLYSFNGNGLANAADYFRTDSFVLSFTDYGLASNFIPPYYIPFSFDLTTIYNQAIINGDEYLGVLLKGTTAVRPAVRYRLTTYNGPPKLVIRIPEPSSLVVTAICLSIVVGRQVHLTSRRS